MAVPRLATQATIQRIPGNTKRLKVLSVKVIIEHQLPLFRPTLACTNCYVGKSGGALFVQTRSGPSSAFLRARPGVVFTPRTKLFVSVASPGAIGRFELFSVTPSPPRLNRLASGCTPVGEYVQISDARHLANGTFSLKQVTKARCP